MKADKNYQNDKRDYQNDNYKEKLRKREILFSDFMGK